MEAAATTPVQKDASLPREDPSTSSPGSTCDIRFLMVNGDSFHLSVPASSTIYDVKHAVIQERPKELMDFLKGSTPSITTMPSKTDEVRILYLGKFLDDVKTLKECKFATGTDNHTVVHISVRVPTDASEDVKEKLNKKTSACCVIM